MNGYYKQVIAMLKQHGFSFDREAKGSHEMWAKGRTSVTVSKTCKSRITADEIMKQAGIRHRF